MSHHIHLNGTTYEVAGNDNSDAERRMREFADRMRHEAEVYVDVLDPVTQQRFNLVVNRDRVATWGTFTQPDSQPKVAGF